MKLTERESEVLQALVGDLRRELGASEVLLYGSAARGELAPESDIDLLVVLPVADWETEKKVIDLCFRAELECGRVFSAACFSVHELENTPLRSSPFLLNARREGRSL